MIVVPFCSLICAVLVAHTILGPIGWTIGEWISNIVWSGLNSNVKWLFAAIFGFVYAPLVITGLHHMTNAIDTQLVSSFGGTNLWPMIALSNIAQGSSVLAMVVLQRKNEKAQQIDVPSMISCYLGVTEPALFGVNLRYGFPFICGMIGSSIAAMISVSAGVTATNIGVGGIPGILSIFPQYWGWFLVAMVVAIVIPFALTYVVGLKKLTAEDRYGKQKNIQKDPIEFVAPMSGTLHPLSEIEDQVFSQGMMGQGYAIELNDGKVCAPFSGEVIMTFPTGHAIGLRRSDGVEVLIHIGMDTVELDGRGFKMNVRQGDHVKTGDVLVEVDLDLVKKAGKSLVSPVVITSGQNVELKKQGVAHIGDLVAIV